MILNKTRRLGDRGPRLQLKQNWLTGKAGWPCFWPGDRWSGLSWWLGGEMASRPTLNMLKLFHHGRPCSELHKSLYMTEKMLRCHEEFKGLYERMPTGAVQCT